MKVKEDDESYDKDSRKEKEMSLFIKHYNQYIQKHWLKHFDKNLINFRKYHPYTKEEKKKEENVTCFECGKFGHYHTTCLSLSKRNKKNGKNSYKTKTNNTKGRRAYIAWEDEDESSSSSSSSSYDNESANFG
ncbi:uncharacterized protein LOC127096094 [Lathyrus oleraceus]|uniref:uncharacterized protein LOC127096094 n=1 Tax=Pisum sativum TaxID=3888 RepID=UPI0021D3D77E|nr:uncharacterized protein LOC127096094 [Pisum sativum]